MIFVLLGTVQFDYSEMNTLSVSHTVHRHICLHSDEAEASLKYKTLRPFSSGLTISIKEGTVTSLYMKESFRQKVLQYLER